MDYRHKNYGANKSWNQKEKVWALIENRNPRMRPECEADIPIAIAHNKLCILADRQNISVEDLKTPSSDWISWDEMVINKYKTRLDELSQTNSRGYKSNETMSAIRFDRELQGGSRKKGGRTSWPRKMK